MPRAVSAFIVTCLVAIGAQAWAAPTRRGISLGLFSEDAGWSYAGLLDEIARTGATDVELVVPLYQADVEATEVGYHPRYSPPLATVRRAIQAAHAHKLRVLLFPIVRLVQTHGPNEWRGTLRPRDRIAWMRSYGRRLEELATIAKEERVDALSIGSELSTLDMDGAPWSALRERVRARFDGLLVYSANWDHFEQVGLWPLVDRIGVCAYFPLGEPAPVATLAAAWRGPQGRLEALARRWQKVVWLTELGYRSQPNALDEPWDEGSAVAANAEAHERQRLGFAAFAAAFASPRDWLDGFFVWNWYGWGGPGSRGYTPRGKPAAAEIEKLLKSSR